MSQLTDNEGERHTLPASGTTILKHSFMNFLLGINLGSASIPSRAQQAGLRREETEDGSGRPGRRGRSQPRIFPADARNTITLRPWRRVCSAPDNKTTPASSPPVIAEPYSRLDFMMRWNGES